jgi:hypothetical protein
MGSKGYELEVIGELFVRVYRGHMLRVRDQSDLRFR